MYGRCISKNNQKGFTLLETIGAFIVFVVLIAGAYSLLLQAVKLHQKQESIVKSMLKHEK
jgi:Tfp pilus assembly protein PilV